MKLLALPRGQQKAIHGAVVNVPSNVSSVITSLPLTPNQAGLVPLKLKRRLQYKGYVMHQFIRPQVVLGAVQWLVDNNPLYSNISVNTEWTQLSAQEDKEVWEGISGGQLESLTSTDLLLDLQSSSSDVEPSDADSENEQMIQKLRGLKYNTCL